MPDSKQFYAQLLALKSPWRVAEVHFRVEARAVVVEVECGDEGLVCSECEARSPRHDERRRRLEHLETMGFRNILSVKRPRVRCLRHGVQRISAPAPSGTPPKRPPRGAPLRPGADWSSRLAAPRVEAGRRRPVEAHSADAGAGPDRGAATPGYRPR